MPRIAWFSPLPPTATASASMSAAVLPALAVTTIIDAYTDTPAAPIPGVTVRAAQEFPSRHAVEPYDLVVYHVADEPSHAFVWAHATAVPGLVVLHSLDLHESRRQALTVAADAGRYRAELEEAYANEAALAAAPLPAPHALFRPVIWPLRRALLARARAVAVFDESAAGIIRAESPGVPVVVVATTVAPPALPSRAIARERLGIPEEAIVFASLDPIGWSRHEQAVLTLFDRLASRMPRLRLALPPARTPGPMILGEPPTTSNAGTRESSASANGAAADSPHVVRIAATTDDDRWAVRVAADVGLQIDWPAGAHAAPHAHAAWLAAGTPIVTLDRAPTAGWPLLNPHSWRPLAPPVPGVTAAAPVGIGIPLDDELHSLGRSIERLVDDREMRAALAAAAASWTGTEASPAHVAEGYRIAIDLARAAPGPPAAAPRPPTPEGDRTDRRDDRGEIRG